TSRPLPTCKRNDGFGAVAVAAAACARSGDRFPACIDGSTMRLTVCTCLALLCASSLPEAQRIRYGPGVCGPLDPTYVKVATGTGGQAYPVSAEEMGKSPGPMNASFFEQLILWASGDRDYSYVVPV